MDVRKEYEKLYQQWLNEFQNAELTAINQEDFNEYKKLLNFINYYEEEKDELKNQIIKSYKGNINFLFKDFFKIREFKIINFALSLTEINLNDVTEAEKLLYQNLVSSLKGYKKIKASSLYEEDENINDISLEPEEEVKHEFPKEIISKEKEITKIIASKKQDKKLKINYMLIRFLKKTPPLVGIDLINYGPFEEEDIAHLPQKNAKILIFEKFAEKIDIN